VAVCADLALPPLPFDAAQGGALATSPTAVGVPARHAGAGAGVHDAEAHAAAANASAAVLAGVDGGVAFAAIGLVAVTVAQTTIVP